MIRRTEAWTGRVKRCLAVVVGLSMAASTSFAAEEDGRLWVTAAISVSVTDRLTVSLDLQDRFSDDISELERDLIRPSVRYRWQPWLATSLGYDAHFIESPGPGSQIEQRAWQQVSTPFGTEAVVVTPRVRLEERFIEDVSGVAWRARFGAFVKVPVGADAAWSLLASDEVFVGLNSRHDGPDDGFDQNRAFIGVGRVVGDHLGIEVGYMNQWIERHAVPDLMNHTLVLTLRVH